MLSCPSKPELSIRNGIQPNGRSIRRIRSGRSGDGCRLMTLPLILAGSRAHALPAEIDLQRWVGESPGRDGHIHDSGASLLPWLALCFESPQLPEAESPPFPTPRLRSQRKPAEQ